MNHLPPSRILWAILTMVLMCTQTIVPQSLKSARANAVGAFSGMSHGTSALEWNPAGLTAINDWELSASYYSPWYGSSHTVTLQNAAVGKRFLDDHAAVLQLSPGSTIEFDIPSTVTIDDSAQNPVINTFDKKITYSERYGLGYAYIMNHSFSLAFSAKYIGEQISHTKYSIDTNSVIRSSIVDNLSNQWNIHIGLLWYATPAWTLSAGINNLFHITESSLPAEELPYTLKFPRHEYAGFIYSGIEDIRLGMEADTRKKMRIGGEWSATDFLAARSGVYLSSDGEFQAEAYAVGIGSSYQFLRADLSYIHFLDQTDRQGTVDLTRFEESGIENIEFNPFTSDRLTLSVIVQLGKTYQSVAHIEYVDIVHDVYPSSGAMYSSKPVGIARILNLSPAPIRARVKFFIQRIMDEPTEAPVYTVLPNDVAEIPLYAVFNETLLKQGSLELREAEVTISTSSPQVYDDSYQAQIMIHGKNDWNGDVGMLKYFITPNDSSVIAFTRATLSSAKPLLDTLTGTLQIFEKSKIIFNEFISRLVYVNDPKLTADYVQYPSETLSRNGGDCDDMAVSYSTLLSSIGVSTAFVDVVPPGKSQDAHIYMMLDTGVSPDKSNYISDNPKRFIVRKNADGRESVWIPIETTVLQKGFEEAWRIGAEQYFRDVEVNSGLINGWVHVVDVQPVQ